MPEVRYSARDVENMERMRRRGYSERFIGEVYGCQERTVRRKLRALAKTRREARRDG